MTVPAAHVLHDEGLEGFGEDLRLAGLKIYSPRSCRSCRKGLPDKKVLLEHALTRRQFILQLSAVLPFPDTLSNTLGLARGQVDQDRKDRRTIHKVQGPVSAAGTAPHKSSVRGRASTVPLPPAASGRYLGSLYFATV